MKEVKIMKYKIYSLEFNKIIGSYKKYKKIKAGDFIFYKVSNLKEHEKEIIMYYIDNKINNILFVKPISYIEMLKILKEKG